MQEIVLATGNPGKVRELAALLAGQAVLCRALTEFTQEEAEENGLSFVENAILKARHASRASGLPALADDSGLEVDALAGRPGIHSARYAGEGADRAGRDRANNARLLADLQGLPEARRGARFQCAIVLMRFPEDPMPLVCQGSWEGRILEAPRGNQGFGYDPLFWVPEQGRSSAELEPELKNQLSHRAQALRHLLARWPLKGQGVCP